MIIALWITAYLVVGFIIGCVVLCVTEDFHEGEMILTLSTLFWLPILPFSVVCIFFGFVSDTLKKYKRKHRS